MFEIRLEWEVDNEFYFPYLVGKYLQTIGAEIRNYYFFSSFIHRLYK
jgi:hypothetical protein